MKWSARRALAAPDLLAGVALAAAAAGVALPAVQAARADAARAQCANNLRVLGGGAKGFGAANDGLLPHNSSHAPWGSWNAQLLPFIGEERLARRYAGGRDWWDAGGNRDAAAARVTTFVCPAAPHPDRTVPTRDPDDPAGTFRAAPTDYVGSAGAYYRDNVPANLHPGAMHTRTVTHRLRATDVADGASQTLLVVEMADKPNTWQAGKPVGDRGDRPQMTTFGGGQWAAPNWNHLRSHSADGKEAFGPCAVNCSNQAAVYGFHPGGANALFLDGSVRFLAAGLFQEMLVALVSIAGGELLSPDDF